MYTPLIKNYLNALRETIGEDRFPLALRQMQTAREVLTQEKRKQLELSNNNQERLNLMNAWFGKFLADEVKNCIILLAEKKGLATLDELRAPDGEVPKIIVTTAMDLSSSLRSWLTEQLERYSGRAVSILFRQDPTLIGGVKIRVGDYEIDNSIHAKLKNILR